MAYKPIGTFDTDTLYEIYDDVTPFFESISDAAADMAVMEVGLPDDVNGTPELWHDDYDADGGAWVKGGEFEDVWAAADAAEGFPEGTAVSVYDYSEGTAKLMVRHGYELSKNEDDA